MFLRSLSFLKIWFAFVFKTSSYYKIIHWLQIMEGKDVLLACLNTLLINSGGLSGNFVVSAISLEFDLSYSKMTVYLIAFVPFVHCNLFLQWMYLTFTIFREKNNSFSGFIQPSIFENHKTFEIFCWNMFKLLFFMKLRLKHH